VLFDCPEMKSGFGSRSEGGNGGDGLRHFVPSSILKPNPESRTDCNRITCLRLRTVRVSDQMELLHVIAFGPAVVVAGTGDGHGLLRVRARGHDALDHVFGEAVEPLVGLLDPAAGDCVDVVNAQIEHELGVVIISVAANDGCGAFDALGHVLHELHEDAVGGGLAPQLDSRRRRGVGDRASMTNRNGKIHVFS
jgi:hypothetical protein